VSSVPLEVNDLVKHFGNKIVLDGIDFDLKSGEVFGLVGLNGVGKTTLIKIILDLLKADSGEVKILDVPSILSNSRERLRYLPENFRVSSMLKGMEFLKIFNGFSKTSEDIPAKLESEAFELADILALNRNDLKLKVSKYSKGMVQKLGLISAFLGNPKVVILDEPMSGLDPRARIHLKNLLINSKRRGQTIFFSSHILSDIDEMCDRIGILHDGKMVYIGTPDHLKKKHFEASLEKAFLKEIA